VPAWKVLLTLLFFVVCLGLALATIVVPLTFSGGEMWAWLGGLFAGTLVAGGLFALFLRHAGGAMDQPRR
jgi:Na+/H+-translocating membrane pyrophosphatase